MVVAEFQKKSFIRSGEGAIASYDYTDIAEGTGISLFYGGADVNGTKFLSQEVFYVADANCYTTATAGTETEYTKLFDVDFDLSPFNLPKIVNGKAYVYFYTSWSRNDFVSHKLIFKIRKYSGSTETEIGSGTYEWSPADNGSSAGTIIIDCSRTHFKVGDILRLTCEGWSKDTDGDGGQTLAIYYQPNNADDPTQQLKLYCPFDLDI